MRELSVQAGLPRETISRLENLHRATSLQSLESLASALGVTAHTLTLPRRETAGG